MVEVLKDIFKWKFGKMKTAVAVEKFFALTKFIVRYIILAEETKMENVSISEARRSLAEIAERAIDYDSVINIATKKGNVVLLNEKDYNGLLETLYLLSVPGNREKLLDGKNTPFEDCVAIDWRNDLNG